MKKKTNVRTMIRQIVREEVAMAIGEVVNELKQPSLSSPRVSQPKPQKKIVEKKSFSKNSVLNDILQETAESDEWKTMGGGTYDSSNMNEVISNQYGDMMNGGKVDNSDIIAPQAPDDIKNLFNKDYSGILKASIKKSNGRKG